MSCAAEDRQHRILIVRLSSLRDVAASASHHVLADAVARALPGAEVSFAFLPPPGRPIDFGGYDLVLVSNSFVLESINLPWLLGEAGVVPWAGDRSGDFPPVVLGGSNSLAAQCLVRPDADAVPDAFFFGEGEGALEAFLRAWAGADGLAKRDRLLAAAAVTDGFWITGTWPEAPVRQAVFRGVPPTPRRYDLLDSEAADTVRLQASYGCPAFCSFCFEGMERKPYREVPLGPLLDRARQLKRLSGARAVEVDAFNLNSHRDLAALVESLVRLYDRVAFKSQRVDVLAEVPALLDLELEAGKRSFTLGLEGISGRLRARLHKSLDGRAIDLVLRRLLSARVREIKLFYLLTGDESPADLAEFDAFCRRLATCAGGPGRSTRIVFSFGRLVRMPNTPLRYDRLRLDRAEWDRLAAALEKSCRTSGFESRLAMSWDEYRATQVLAAADYRSAPLVVDLALQGLHYDGRLPPGGADRLCAALAEAGLLTEAEVAAKPWNHVFPFAFVTRAVSADFLHAQYEASLAGEDRGYCLGDGCRQCGACADAAERAALTQRSRPPQVVPAAVRAVAEVTRAKQRLQPVFRRVRLGPEFAGRGPAWVSARLLQAYLAGCPDDVDNVLSIDEWMFTGVAAARLRFPQPAGATVVAIRAWRPEAIADVPAAGSGRGGVDWLGAAEPCDPGDFAEATWTLEVAGSQAAASEAVELWLRSAYLAFTLRRTAGAARFQIAPAALRKRIVAAVTCMPRGTGAAIEVVFHPKADMQSLVAGIERHSGPVACTCTAFSQRPPARGASAASGISGSAG